MKDNSTTTVPPTRHTPLTYKWK